MGAPIGSVLGLAMVAISILIGLFAGAFWGATALNAIAYLFFCYVLVLLYVTRPTNMLLIASLRPADRGAFAAYHLFIRFPGASTLYSGLLNLLRLALIVWGGIAAWNGHYVVAGISFAYFAITSLYVARLDPFTYMRVAAAKGNEVAIDQLASIERVQHRYRQIVEIGAD
jgi:hypothetical protein